MRHNRRLLVIACVAGAAALFALAVTGPGATAPLQAAAPAPLYTPSPLIEGFAEPSSSLSVTRDNGRFVRGRPDVAVKRVSYVTGKLGGCMRVDLTMLGGLRKSVMVQVNKRVPLNLSGQDTLDFTMTGDWADEGGAQSVTVAPTMLNVALYYQSLTVTKSRKTYHLALNPAVYQMTATFGDQTMPAYVDLNGATYNVFAFDAGADQASLRLQMYSRQTVRVKLPFTPASVECNNPQLMIGGWSYADGFLTMDVRGTTVTDETGTITISASPAAQPDWSAVDDFLYQLQNLSLLKAGNSHFDLVITDYARNGHEATRFTPGQIAALQHSPGGAKRVLAYMSIGEAEAYRWYWKKRWDANGDGVPDRRAPSWLGRSNPDWLDNYKVRFWYPAWQKIIYGTPGSYLDKIIADGYDGVYLDIIDAYEYWGPGGQGKPVRKQAAQDMVDFVCRLADYARVVKGKPDFAIFPQNGAGLGRHPEYTAVVTGIGQEDTWYNGDAVSPWTAGTVPALKRFKSAGKLVLCTDYCRRPARIDRFYRKAQALGFVPYATVRDLDKLVVNPGHAPD